MTRNHKAVPLLHSNSIQFIPSYERSTKIRCIQNNLCENNWVY